MEKYVTSLIDKLIRENAYKNRDGYHLFIDDVSINEQNKLIQSLLKFDGAMQDIVKDHIQDLINERIDRVYTEDRINDGFKPVNDRQTGELYFVPVRN